MDHSNDIKVQIKTGLSFCWLNKNLVELLDKLVFFRGFKGRGDFINYEIFSCFSFKILDKSDFFLFDKHLNDLFFKSRAEWLSDVIRNQLSLLDHDKIIFSSPSVNSIDELIQTFKLKFENLNSPIISFSNGNVIFKSNISVFYFRAIYIDFLFEGGFFTVDLFSTDIVELNFTEDSDRVFKFIDRATGKEIACLV